MNDHRITMNRNICAKLMLHNVRRFKGSLEIKGNGHNDAKNRSSIHGKRFLCSISLALSILYQCLQYHNYNSIMHKIQKALLWILENFAVF